MSRVLSLLLALFAAGCDLAPPSASPRQTQVLVFTAPWCRQCQVDKQVLQGVRLRVALRYIDVDKQPSLATTHQVSVLPTYVVIRNGREVFRTSDVSQVVSTFR